ncbi:MAG: YqjK-like family protein [Burkholderiaceae bacterium]|jgi:hypothetical protein|nr:YqjK-like family protein [Burkholderiaceae bacterium]
MNRPSPSRQDLAARHQELLLRSAQLREQLAQHAQIFRPALHVADKVRGGAQWMQRNPVWPLLGAAALGMAAMRPRMVLRLTARAWSGWQLLRRVRPAVTTLLRRLT